VVRVKVQWEEIRLPTATEPGYGEKALPVEQLVKQDGANGSPARPTLVWFYRQDDKFLNDLIQTTTLQDESIVLSLKKLRCVRIDVATIPDEESKKTYENTPAFHFYDPHAECLGKLEGDDAIAITRFAGLVKKTWSKVFTMSQSSFVKNMQKALDGYDRITAKRAKLSSRDDAKRQGLEAEEAKLRDLEKDTMEKCTLKKEYLPSE
jgi:hypothetical protein